MIVVSHQNKNYDYQLNYIPYRYRLHYLKKKLLPFSRQKHRRNNQPYPSRKNAHIHPNPLPMTELPASTLSQTDRSWEDEQSCNEVDEYNRSSFLLKNNRNECYSEEQKEDSQMLKDRQQMLWKDLEHELYADSESEQDAKPIWSDRRIEQVNKINYPQGSAQRQYQSNQTGQKRGSRQKDDEEVLEGVSSMQKLSRELLKQKLADTTIKSNWRIDELEEGKDLNRRSINHIEQENANRPQSSEDQNTETHHALNLIKKYKHFEPFIDHQADRNPTSYHEPQPHFTFSPGTLSQRITNAALQASHNQSENQHLFGNPKGQDMGLRDNIGSMSPSLPRDKESILGREKGKESYINKYNLYKELKASKEKAIRMEYQRQQINSIQNRSAQQHENFDDIEAFSQERTTEVQKIEHNQDDRLVKLSLNAQQHTADLLAARAIGQETSNHSYKYTFSPRNHQDLNQNTQIKQFEPEQQESRQQLNAIAEREQKQKTGYYSEHEKSIGRSYATRLHAKKNELTHQLQSLQQQNQVFAMKSIKKGAKNETPQSIGKNQDLEHVWSFSDLISEDDSRLFSSKIDPSKLPQNSPNQFDSECPSLFSQHNNQPEQAVWGRPAICQKIRGKVEERRSDVKSSEEDQLLRLMGGSENLKQLSSLRLDSNQSGVWNEQALKEELSYFLKVNKLPQESPNTNSEEPSLFSSSYHFERHNDYDFNLMDALREDGERIVHQNQTEQNGSWRENADLKGRGLVMDARGPGDNDRYREGQFHSKGESDTRCLFTGEQKRENNWFEENIDVIEESEEHYLPSLSSSRAIIERPIADYRNHFHPRQALQRFKRSTSQGVKARSSKSGSGEWGMREGSSGRCVEWKREMGALVRAKKRWQLNLGRFNTRINHF